MKRRSVAIRELSLQDHPQVARLTSADPIALAPPVSPECLSEHEITILLHTITLHVTQDRDDHYLLLTPDPLFAWLRQHPYAQSLKITLCIYDDAEPAINTLLLICPAIMYRMHSDTTLSMLAHRLHHAKSSATQSEPPTKRLLADLAGVTSSAIRICWGK